MDITKTITASINKTELEAIILERMAKQHPEYNIRSITFNIYPPASNTFVGNVNVVYPGNTSPAYFTGVSLVLELKPA